MSDLREEMERTKKRAAAFGVSSEEDESDRSDESTTDDESPEEEPSETQSTAETSSASEASETLETSPASETVETQSAEPAGAEDESAPNREEEGVERNSSIESGADSTDEDSDAESTDESASRGRLVDEYDNVNIYIPPELKRELNDLYKLMDLEHSRSSGEDLEKHWDFYPAVVRTVLRNEDDLRSELDIDT